MRRTAILTPWCQRCFVSLVLTACGRKDPVKAAMIAAKPPWPDQCHRFWPLNSFWIYRTSQRCARGACKALREHLWTKIPWECSDVWQTVCLQHLPACHFTTSLVNISELLGDLVRVYKRVFFPAMLSRADLRTMTFLNFHIIWWWAQLRTVKQIIQSTRCLSLWLPFKIR